LVTARRCLQLGVLLMVTVFVCLAANPAVTEAFHLYQRTDYDGALKILQAIPDKDAMAWRLLGRALYMRGDFKKATEAFEKSVALRPNDSRTWMWLGRAYGRRAETSSFVTAPGYANKTRACFERAVQSDPKNLEAMNDLFEYYLEAPGFLGGGLHKAEALSRRIGELDPAEYHYAQGKLAEKRKEFKAAEQQFRRAVDLAPRQVGRVVDLANFFAKQGRYQESDAAFRQAQKIAPGAPKVIFERANAYIRANRNLDEARSLLKQYLDASLTPDDPPRKDAERLLKASTGG
jgi:Flp pilus assembly protein TadD